MYKGLGSMPLRMEITHLNLALKLVLIRDQRLGLPPSGSHCRLDCRPLLPITNVPIVGTSSSCEIVGQAGDLAFATAGVNRDVSSLIFTAPHRRRRRRGCVKSTKVVVSTAPGRLGHTRQRESLVLEENASHAAASVHVAATA